MYRLDNKGEIGAPCGVPRFVSLFRVVRCLRPRSSVSSTGVTSHCFTRCSMALSLTRRATHSINSACGRGLENGRDFGLLGSRGSVSLLPYPSRFLPSVLFSTPASWARGRHPFLVSFGPKIYRLCLLPCFLRFITACLIVRSCLSWSFSSRRSWGEAVKRLLADRGVRTQWIKGRVPEEDKTDPPRAAPGSHHLPWDRFSIPSESVCPPGGG